MNCPKCNEEMALKNQEKSQHAQTSPGIVYDCLSYWCEEDDIWIKVETPVSDINDMA